MSGSYLILVVINVVNRVLTMFSQVKILVMMILVLAISGRANTSGIYLRAPGRKTWLSALYLNPVLGHIAVTNRPAAPHITEINPAADEFLYRLRGEILTAKPFFLTTRTVAAITACTCLALKAPGIR